MRARVVWAVMRVTFREHLRTPEALFWTYAFPVLIAVVLGLAFGERPPSEIEAVVLEGQAAAAMQALLDSHERIHAEVRPRPEADRMMLMGEADVLVSGAPSRPVVRLDPTRDTADLAGILVNEALQREAGREDPVPVAVEHETRPGARYIDFLIPGLVGLNLLGAGIWGVGFQLVTMRTKHLLRRLLVAPMGRGEFLLGFLLSRVVLMVPESLIIVAFGALAFGVPVRGSLLLLVTLLGVGSIAFAGLGALVAARPRSIEGVSGVMNLILLPMWLLGGSFFSNARFPDAMQPLVAILPLTHINNALRELMLGGGSLAEVWPAAAYLAACAVVFLFLALRFFRWT